MVHIEWYHHNAANIIPHTHPKHSHDNARPWQRYAERRLPVRCLCLFTTCITAWAMSYYCDTTLSQEFQPMEQQLSLEAALPLAKRFATASDRCSKTGPSTAASNIVLDLNSLYRTWKLIRLFSLFMKEVRPNHPGGVLRQEDKQETHRSQQHKWNRRVMNLVCNA